MMIPEFKEFIREHIIKEKFQDDEKAVDEFTKIQSDSPSGVTWKALAKYHEWLRAEVDKAIGCFKLEDSENFVGIQLVECSGGCGHFINEIEFDTEQFCQSCKERLGK